MGQAYDNEGKPLGLPELGQDWAEVLEKIDNQKLKGIQEIRLKKLTRKQSKEIKGFTEEQKQVYLTELISKVESLK